MFGKRPDGEQIKDLSRLRAFMPFVSPRRNDSLVLYTTEIEVDEALAFIDRYNEGREEKRRMTLFHLYLRSLATAFHKRPGVNRFVAGGRLWQRNHVAVTFSAKQDLVDGSPMLTVKRIFPEHETLDQMVDSILDNLAARRRGRENRSDKEVKFALQLPPTLVKVGVWALHRANQLGLLSRGMIDDDPLFCSVFVANLGSVGLGAGFHHLWERGTCSIFGVMGRVEERPDGKRSMQVAYTYDERIEDGLYSYHSLEGVRERIENPELLELSTDELARRASDDSVR